MTSPRWPYYLPINPCCGTNPCGCTDPCGNPCADATRQTDYIIYTGAKIKISKNHLNITFIHLRKCQKIFHKLIKSCRLISDASLEMAEWLSIRSRQSHRLLQESAGQTLSHSAAHTLPATNLLPDFRKALLCL